MTFVRLPARRAWWVLVLLLGLLPRAVQAQDPPITRLARLDIDLWPEYDQPAMLVIYRMTLNPEDVPGRLSLRIPQRAGRPYAVALGASPQSDLLNATYEYQPATGSPWAWVHINVSQPYVQLEYYDPALEKDGQRRSYRFLWPGDLEVGQVVVQVQRPWNAQDLVVDPPLTPVGATTAGIELFERSFGALQAGQTLEIRVEYTKPDDVLTVEHLQAVQAPAAGGNLPPAAVGTTPSRALLGTTEIVLIVAGALLVVASGLWWWRQRGGALPRLARPRGPRGGPSRARFCPQCGTRALPGARFCHQCGTPLP